MGWGGSVISVRHNLSIISPVEHNFEHTTLVSRVTPESIILYFSSIIPQTLTRKQLSGGRDVSSVGRHIFLQVRQIMPNSFFLKCLLNGNFVKNKSVFN